MQCDFEDGQPSFGWYIMMSMLLCDSFSLSVYCEKCMLFLHQSSRAADKDPLLGLLLGFIKIGKILLQDSPKASTSGQ